MLQKKDKLVAVSSFGEVLLTFTAQILMKMALSIASVDDMLDKAYPFRHS